MASLDENFMISSLLSLTIELTTKVIQKVAMLKLILIQYKIIYLFQNKLRAALPESSQQLKSSSAAPSAPVQIQVTASASTPSSSSSDSAAVAEAAGDDATGEAGGKKGGRNKAPPAGAFFHSLLLCLIFQRSPSSSRFGAIDCRSN